MQGEDLTRHKQSTHSKAIHARKELFDILRRLTGPAASDLYHKLNNEKLNDHQIISLYFQYAAAKKAGTLVQKASTSFSSWSSGDWEGAKQYVKSMICDPAQFEKLYRNAVDSSDRNALNELKREFDEAKRTGTKVEKRPEEWNRARNLVERAKNGQRAKSLGEPSAERAMYTTGTQDKATYLAKISELMSAHDVLDTDDVCRLDTFDRWIRGNMMDSGDWSNCKALIARCEKQVEAAKSSNRTQAAQNTQQRIRDMSKAEQLRLIDRLLQTGLPSYEQADLESYQSWIQNGLMDSGDYQRFEEIAKKHSAQAAETSSQSKGNGFASEKDVSALKQRMADIYGRQNDDVMKKLSRYYSYDLRDENQVLLEAYTTIKAYVDGLR